MISENFKEGLTYDDVLLIPKYSAVYSRKEIDISSTLTDKIKLNLPIISAPMDTVTESPMAIALARMGALGIIHRFNTIDKQAEEVRRVKRTENYFLEKPLSVDLRMKIKEVLELAQRLNKYSFVVIDQNNTLLGLLSKRDYIFEQDQEKTVEQLMTPFAKLICVNEFISLTEAKQFFQKHKIEKLPVVDQQRRLKGLITSKDVIQCSNVKAVRDAKGRLMVGAAIGVKSDFLERAKALVEAGVDLLVLDIAHGHLDICLTTAQKLKTAFPNLPIMVGNIATKDGAADLAKVGADIIRVGVGAGAVCTTRIITGSGVPQLTAVIEAKKGAGQVPIVADAGIKSSGDMVKALAAGASAVMIGSLLAGTDEAPGRVTIWNRRKVKLFRGMASFAAYEDKSRNLSQAEVNGFIPLEAEYPTAAGRDTRFLASREFNEPRELLTGFTAEGVDQAFVPYKGAVTDLLYAWEGGIRSGFSYSGAQNLTELWQKSEFIKVSQVGLKENGPHDVAEA